MSSAEFSRWIHYRARYGAMDDRRTFDRPAALVSAVVARSFGGKAEIEDFMPYKPKDEDQVISRPEELLSVFGGLKQGKRKR